MAPPFNSRVDRRQRDWHRLAALLDIVDQGGLKALSGAELAELSRLHRRVSSHLAQAQGGASDPDIVAYLNGLVVRSHNAVYRVPTGVQWRRVGAFLTDTYPRTVRKLWPYVLVASLVFFGSGLFAFILSYSDPTLARLFVPAQFAGAIGPGGMPDYQGNQLPTGIMAPLSAFIMQNNIKVGFTAFAGGVLAGVYTLYALLQNGLMVGGLSGGMHHYGNVLPYYSLIVPHGVVELWAIVLAGASGLRLGWAIIAPGRFTRWEALKRAAPEAATVMLGTVLLFVVAALIEGFVTPAPLPPWPKVWVGIISGILMLAYQYGPLARGPVPEEAWQPSAGNTDP